MFEGKNTYTITYYCSNCNTRTIQSFEKGTIAPNVTICNNCGYVRAEKLGWSKPNNSLPYKYRKSLDPFKYFEKGGKINAFG